MFPVNFDFTTNVFNLTPADDRQMTLLEIIAHVKELQCQDIPRGGCRNASGSGFLICNRCLALQKLQKLAA